MGGQRWERTGGGRGTQRIAKRRGRSIFPRQVKREASRAPKVAVTFSREKGERERKVEGTESKGREGPSFESLKLRQPDDKTNEQLGKAQLPLNSRHETVSESHTYRSRLSQAGLGKKQKNAGL